MTDKIFCIELDFLPDKDDPLKIFESFKLMIESQILIQTELLKSSNPLANISFVLNGIEIGSILARIVRKYIKIQDDKEELFESELKGNIDEYIDQSNEMILNKLSGATTQSITENDVKDIIENISKIAANTGVKENSNFRIPTDEKIIETLEKAKSATDILPNGKYIFTPNTNDNKIIISKINLDIKHTEIVDKPQEYNTQYPMILKIKIVDFLGETKWKFITSDGRKIDAKIIDTEWLDRFHQNKEHLSSGDCLDVEMDIKRIDDSKLEYTILKVNKVIKSAEQREFEM